MAIASLLIAILIVTNLAFIIITQFIFGIFYEKLRAEGSKNI